jgi:hypothetical protein
MYHQNLPSTTTTTTLQTNLVHHTLFQKQMIYLDRYHQTTPTITTSTTSTTTTTTSITR